MSDTIPRRLAKFARCPIEMVDCWVKLIWANPHCDTTALAFRDWVVETGDYAPVVAERQIRRFRDRARREGQ